jgi:hypothetical protein
MVDTNSPEWEIHYRNAMRRSRRRLEQMLDRFGESLHGWPTAALNWPREDWEADLADFIAHSRMTGIELSEESLGQIRGLIEARVNGTGVFAERTFSDESLEQTRSLIEGRENETRAFAAHTYRRGDRDKPMIQLASMTITPDSGTDATLDLSEGPKEEVAGPGPKTSFAFNQKVQAMLELLDSDVAEIWRQYQGLVRVRDGNWLQFSYYSERDKKKLVIVVSPHFTAQDTATAILTEAYTSSWLSAFTNPIHSALLKKKLLTDEEVAKRFAEIRTEAFKEAAATAAFFAESYYGAIASLTPGGDLIVTIDDIDRNGFNFTHLLIALPALAYLSKKFKRLILKLPGGKTLELPGQLLEKLNSLPAANRNVIVAKAKKAKTKEEALAIVTKGIAEVINAPGHHLATNKNWFATLRGGPWSSRFAEIFEKAGMTLKDAENIVNIPGHTGPHLEPYHRAIFERLTKATEGQRGKAYKDALISELRAMAKEALTDGTKLNRLLHKK